MTAALIWLGTGVASVVLLMVSHGLDRRDPRAAGAFRGASIGFLVGTLLTLAVLIAPPMHWPPDTARAALLVLAVPLPTLLGALGGRWRGTGGGRAAGDGSGEADQG